MTRIALPPLLFRTGIARACLEMAPVMLVLLLTLRMMPEPWQPPYNTTDTIFLISSIVFGIVCPLWCAFRIRKSSGAWWKQIAQEAGIALATTIILAAMLLLAAFLCYQGNITLESFAFYPLLSLIVFTLFRALLHFAHFWSCKRRESFAFNLANSILAAILIAPPVLFSIYVVSWIALAPNDQLERNITLLIGLGLGISIIADIIAIPCLLPPALLFSYLAAQHLTGRVNTLAQATSEMRKGNYSIRVAVQGEDEVARLQSDFNAMASDLNRTVHELQTERDRVAGILQSRRELVAGVSHDLRTPIATIRAHLESTRGVKSRASFDTELKILDREVLRLQSLIEDLFTLSQAEVDKLTLDLKPVDAGAIVRDRVAAMAPLAWQSGRVQVTAQVAANVPPAVADRMRFEQALTNLIHNAARHTPPGGVVMVGVSAEADAVHIDVRDTGEGIAPGDLPLIWDRYYQGNGTSASLGAGLGLALVKEFAEAMGGAVSVESQQGQGSCFTIRLRCA